MPCRYRCWRRAMNPAALTRFIFYYARLSEVIKCPVVLSRALLAGYDPRKGPEVTGLTGPGRGNSRRVQGRGKLI